jgi:hypothetical protein
MGPSLPIYQWIPTICICYLFSFIVIKCLPTDWHCKDRLDTDQIKERSREIGIDIIPVTTGMYQATPDLMA